MRLALAFLVLVACAPTLAQRARVAAHEHVRGDQRLACETDAIAIDVVSAGRDRLSGDGEQRTTLTAEEIAHLRTLGEVYVAWCPSAPCCPGSGGFESVTVHCVDRECEAIGDDFGACRDVACATY